MNNQKAIKHLLFQSCLCTVDSLNCPEEERKMQKLMSNLTMSNYSIPETYQKYTLHKFAKADVKLGQCIACKYFMYIFVFVCCDKPQYSRYFFKTWTDFFNRYFSLSVPLQVRVLQT